MSTEAILPRVHNSKAAIKPFNGFPCLIVYTINSNLHILVYLSIPCMLEHVFISLSGGCDDTQSSIQVYGRQKKIRHYMKLLKFIITIKLSMLTHVILRAPYLKLAGGATTLHCSMLNHLLSSQVVLMTPGII